MRLSKNLRFACGIIKPISDEDLTVVESYTRFSNTSYYISQDMTIFIRDVEVKPNNLSYLWQASGRPWKSPGERAGALKNPLLSTSWEKKMKLKAESKAFKTFKKEAIAAHKEKLEVSLSFILHHCVCLVCILSVSICHIINSKTQADSLPISYDSIHWFEAALCKLLSTDVLLWDRVLQLVDSCTNELAHEW